MLAVQKFENPLTISHAPGTVANYVRSARKMLAFQEAKGLRTSRPSSAGLVRHRLNRGGNRRFNTVLCRIGLTQTHHHPEARAYHDRRIADLVSPLGGPLHACPG